MCLKKAKLTDDRYPKLISGYSVIASKAASPHQGGIALLWENEHPDFEMEAVKVCTPNLLTFQLVTGEERYFVMGVYIPPLTRRGWKTFASPGTLAPKIVNRCCWGT